MSSTRGLPCPSLLLLALPILGGCVVPKSVGNGDGSGTGTGAATSEGASAMSLDESASGGLGTTSQGTSESGSMLDPCEDPQVVPPPPPVDCSGAAAVIQGTVVIEEGGDDPSILEGVVRVEGALRIHGTELTDLDFMACVEHVGADVTIFDNDQLVDVGGLWSLSEIGTDFVFSQNDAIEAFDGLPNVVVMQGSVIVRENASLQRLDGFHRLERLEGMGTDEEGNPVGGNVLIQINPVLERIDGLLGLKVIHGMFAAYGDNLALCCDSVEAVEECVEVGPTPLPPNVDPVGLCVAC